MADTLDEISGGRLILGLGAGYHEREYRAFGYPFDHLVGRFEEALQIIHRRLRVGNIDFHGKYYSALACELRPRGPRGSGPPILVGAPARSPRMLRLTAQYADYWNGWSINQVDERLASARQAVDTACVNASRDPATLQRTVTVLIDLPGSEKEPGRRLGTALPFLVYAACDRLVRRAGIAAPGNSPAKGSAMFRSGWSLVPWPGLTPSLRCWTYSTGVNQGALIRSGFKGPMRLTSETSGFETGSLAHSHRKLTPRSCCSVVCCGSNVSEGSCPAEAV